MTAPALADLAAAWPAISDWSTVDGVRTGRTYGGAIVVGRDFVEVFVQGIPGPARSHDGTIAGVRRAVRASMSSVVDLVDLLDPERAADGAADYLRDLTNEVVGLRMLVDEIEAIAVDSGNELFDVQTAIVEYRGFRS